MPDVPRADWTDLLSETWFSLGYAAYHLAYVQIYTRSNVFLYRMEVIWDQNDDIRRKGQEDLIVCRANLAAFFMQLEHFFEGVTRTVKRAKVDFPYLYEDFEPWLESRLHLPIRAEIRDYRNHCHQIPAIIGSKWDGGIFLHLFLPQIEGHAAQENVELTERLRRYFEFASDVWTKLVPEGLSSVYPRDFTYPVTIPALYSGELPPTLDRVPQLFITVQQTESPPLSKSDEGAPPLRS